MSVTKFLLLGLLAAYHITGHEINQEQSLGRFTPFQAVLGNSSIEAGESPFFGLTKRQTCNPGDGYCSNNGGCCPQTNRCCPWGCLEPGAICCAGGICTSSEKCCGNGCIPTDHACCVGGGHCEAGNHCYQDSTSGEINCCTNSRCTAWVLDGKTTTGAVITQLPTVIPTTIVVTAVQTVDQVHYYYFTVEWWYRYYYYTYNVILSASTVTYSTVTETTTISVLASASSEASSELELITRTMSFPTPASATRLAASTRNTIFDAEVTATETRRTNLPTSGTNHTPSFVVGVLPTFLVLFASVSYGLMVWL